MNDTDYVGCPICDNDIEDVELVAINGAIERGIEIMMAVQRQRALEESRSDD